MTESPQFLILGCGFTGSRVARLLAGRGFRVAATSRHPAAAPIEGVRMLELDLTEPRTLRELCRQLQPGTRALHSIPVLEGPLENTAELLDALGDRLARVVYLSTTAVYGDQREVNESTPVRPVSKQARLRVAAEQLVLQGPWSSLVLRPAAIYGPGRGIQVSLPRGDFKLAEDGTNFVSRIHVDDLAALSAAALLSDQGGAWPVADEMPARSMEVVQFVCGLMNLPLPPSAPRDSLHESRRANRRVDGRAACSILDVKLRYPSYLTGIPASL